MTESQMPKVTQFGQVSTSNLDTAKLIEAARTKLAYAKGELDRIKRNHAMKMVEIAENARIKMDAVREEAQEAIRILDDQTRADAQPARDMIDLVQSMIDYKNK